MYDTSPSVGAVSDGQSGEVTVYITRLVGVKTLSEFLLIFKVTGFGLLSCCVVIFPSVGVVCGK